MIELPENLMSAVKEMSRLPGVGQRTALRQIMNIVNWEHDEIKNFSLALGNLTNIKKCSQCGMFAEVELCDFCQSESRKSSKTICVVENVSDLMAIENSGTYSGLYHILGGVLNPLSGIGPDHLKLDLLKERVNSLEIQEIILAINPTVEGDATSSYIKQIMPEQIEIQRIGFGIPIGGSLEYLDPMTISKALENKKLF
jgi:recombination protein RecR